MRNRSLFNRAALGRRQRFIVQGLLLLLAAAALGFSVYVLGMPANAPDIRINEVLVSSRDGEGFIELVNAGAVPVNLDGWFLSDGDHRPLRWRIPPMVLAPGEYVFFYASGLDGYVDGVWHTDFRIRSDGSEPVLLTMPDGRLHDRIAPFENFVDVSFGRTANGVFAHFPVPTAGRANAGEYFFDIETLVMTTQRLLIAEYMTRNESFAPDADGAFHSWAQLYNPGYARVDLQGWFLSDNEANPTKWRFPAGYYIDPGAVLLLQFSGQHGRRGHVPFRLAESDISLTLSDPNGFIMDRIPLFRTPLWASFGRDVYGGEGFLSVPSPGGRSPVRAVETVAELAWAVPTLRIMEYMSNNNFVFPDEDGDFNNWVEIYNFGAHAVALGGISLSDSSTNLDKWTFPAGMVLDAGARLVVQLSGKDLPLHAGFALSLNDCGLFLSDHYGRIIDAVNIIRPPSHVSVGRCEEDAARWLFFPRPTPGVANYTLGLEELAGITANAWGGLFISRVSAADWVEITNASDEYLDMDGWRVTNSAGAMRYRAERTLPARLVAPGETVRVATQAFNIRTRGETLMLFDPDGFLVDTFATGTLRTGVDAVRTADDTSVVLLGGAGGALYTGFALPPEANINDLLVDYGTEIILTTRDADGVIFFTLDGSEPTLSALRYDAPIVITENTVLRARVFSPGRLPSTILTRTFLLENPHELPIVTLVSEPEGLFSHHRGIFAHGPNWSPYFPHFGANFWQRWHRDTHFAFFEDSVLRVEADADMRIHGSFSRGEPQVSLAVFFRGSHGLTQLVYPLIPHIDRHRWDSLILRTSGQDWRNTKLRDAFIHTALEGVTDLTVMAATPVVVYINAQYWGLYNLREKINDDYFRLNHGTPNDQIDILRADGLVVSGTNNDYRELINALWWMDMNTQAAYDFVTARIDLDNWIDYWIAITFFGNTDTGNIRFYRLQDGDNRWRWNIFDQDWALFPATYTWNPFSDNMLHPYGHGAGRNFSTVLNRALLRNDTIRQRFLERYAYLLSYALSAERLLRILDDYTAQIAAEIPRQAERWRGPSSYQTWRNNINRMRLIVEGRPVQIQGFIQRAFGLNAVQMAELFG